MPSTVAMQMTQFDFTRSVSHKGSTQMFATGVGGDYDICRQNYVVA